MGLLIILVRGAAKLQLGSVIFTCGVLCVCVCVCVCKWDGRIVEMEAYNEARRRDCAARDESIEKMECYATSRVELEKSPKGGVPSLAVGDGWRFGNRRRAGAGMTSRV
jgi:hypothetical protein